MNIDKILNKIVMVVLSIIMIGGVLLMAGVITPPSGADNKQIWTDYTTSNIVIIEYNNNKPEALKSWLDENTNKRICKIEDLEGTWIVYYSEGGPLKEARCINR